ncbi:hypothetical protein [Caulobacter segnis]|nr:hypothetical protein [Caulobacter segnis]
MRSHPYISRRDDRGAGRVAQGPPAGRPRGGGAERRP